MLRYSHSDVYKSNLFLLTSLRFSIMWPYHIYLSTPLLMVILVVPGPVMPIYLVHALPNHSTSWWFALNVFGLVPIWPLPPLQYFQLQDTTDSNCQFIGYARNWETCQSTPKGFHQQNPTKKPNGINCYPQKKWQGGKKNGRDERGTHSLKKDFVGLPWWHSGWESACQCRGHGFEPWSGRIPHAAEQLGP